MVATIPPENTVDITDELQREFNQVENSDELPSLDRTLHILLVDDELFQLKILTQYLQPYKISKAQTVVAAIDLLNQYSFDVVLTDIQLELSSGMEVVRYVQQNQPDIPVIVVSAFGDKEMAIQALRNGAYDFLEKPFTQEELIFSVQRAIDKRNLYLQREQTIHQVFAHAKEIESINVLVEATKLEYEKKIKQLEERLNQRTIELNGLRDKLSNPC